MNRFSRSAAWWRGAIGAMLAISLLVSGLGQVAADAAIAPQTVSNAQNGASTSLTISKPTGVAVGDLLLAQVTFEKGSDAGSNTAITPSGWTLIVRTNRSTDIGQAIFYKVALAADVSATGYTWSFSQSVKAAGGIIRYTGVDTSSPIVASSGNSGDSSTLTALAVTATAQSQLVAFYGMKKKDVGLSTPSGMTQRYLFQNPDDVRIKATDELRTAAGATGNRVSSTSPVTSDKWVAHLVVLRAAVTNTPPTVGTVSGSATVNEGTSSGAYSVSATDPDSDPLSYAWSVLSGNATIPGATTGPNVSVSFGDGPSSVQLQVVVSDGKGGVETRSLTIGVLNVAPSAVFSSPVSVDEGGSIGLALTAPSDPSGADTGAGFQFAFDCGDGAGFGAFGTTASVSCATTDDGVRTVGGRIRDKDGGVSEYTATVSVMNVAPSATLVFDDPVDEGGAFPLSLTDASDPSVVDAAAGFEFAFDCGDGAGYGAFGGGSSVACGADDNGTRAVGAKVRDIDGGEREYTASVEVLNVAPVATFGAPASVNEGSPIALELTGASDPSGADTAAGFAYGFDCGDGSGFGAFSATASASCTTTDDASRLVGGRVQDQDLGASTYTATVEVLNVAPSAVFSAPVSVDEGSPIALSLTGPSDPSSVDTAAGFEFAFDCGDGAGFGAFGTAASVSCATTDNGDRTVGAQIRDKDGGVSNYTATVAVNNVAPTATFLADPAGGIVDEGNDIVLSLTDHADPSSADTTAGFEFAFDCGDGIYGDFTGTGTLSCPAADNGPSGQQLDVGGKIRDKDGGVTEYRAGVVVLNVAPSATFVAPVSVNEGSPIGLSLTGLSDPSSVDTAAGFEFAFDCGDGAGFGTFGAAASVSCVTTDDGGRAVGARIRDKDGDYREYSAEVGVVNVAPVGAFRAPGPVDEGVPIFLTFTDLLDPSSVDSAAGFEFAFDCDDGNGFSAFGTATLVLCPTTDSGDRTVGGRIRDKDGGVTEYTETVSILNVVPVATFNAPVSVDEGTPIGLSLTDLSGGATAGFEFGFDCGDGTGFGAYSAAASASCATTDDGTRTVGGRVQDADLDASTYTATVEVLNVAPSATFNAPVSVDEGSPIALWLTGPSDPSSADTAAGFEYAFDCGDGSGFGAFGTTASASCATTDDGERTVGGRIRDKDGGVSEYTALLTVVNVAPSATLVVDDDVVDEGSSFSLSLTDASDPSSVDTATGLEFAFDCGDGDGYGAFGGVAAVACGTDGPGTRDVGAKIRDKDGGEREYTATVSVLNLAPVATFTAPASVDEGSPIALSLTDPSSANTTGGFDFGFDCGDGGGFGSYSTTAAASCATTDDGTRSVGGRVRDEDLDATTYTATVEVVNVAPSATFNVPVSVDEGSPIGLSLTDASDPSSADTTAGFEYSFDCGDGAGFGAFGTTASASCATTDNGNRTVGARIRDKDGGVSEYTATMPVLNVAPSATFVAPVLVNEGSPISLSLTGPSDPSSVDTTAGFEYAFDCGDGAGFGAYTTTASASCATADDGDRTVGARIRDKDGGVSEYTATVSIANVTPVATFNASATVDEGSPIALSLTDPSSSGFEFGFDCGDGAGFGAYTTTASASCATTDDGSRMVGGRVRDADLDASTYTATVDVLNVAPSATFSSPVSVDEGSPIGLSLTDPSDPSSADTAAGFEYAFDCGDGTGFGAYSTTAAASCATADDGDRTVGGRIRDKDGGVREYTALVTVVNVAPVATFVAPVSVNEGSPIALQFTDPSGVGTVAGLEFAFDCGDGAGFGAYSTTASASCATTDNGTRNVGGRARDLDGGGVVEHSARVTVDNVAPTVTAGNAATTSPGVATSFVLGSFIDPGVGDQPWAVTVNWGDGLTDNFAIPTQGTLGSLAHAYTATGNRTVTVRVTDKDGGWSEATFTVTVTAPVQPTLTSRALLANNDVEIVGVKIRIVGDVHSNSDIWMLGAQNDVCGSLTAHRWIWRMSTQTCGTTRPLSPKVSMPSMANHVPAAGAVTQTLTGNRNLNGYTCINAVGCVVRVTGKLEIRGTVTGNVWFVVDGGVVIKGDLRPAANGTSRLHIYSKKSIEAAVSNATISGIFLAEKDIKLSGTGQRLIGLFWGKSLVEQNGNKSHLTGAMISNGVLRLIGADRTVTFDQDAIMF